MEAALKQGDLTAVLGEAEGLPEAAADKMADWLAQVQQRAAALQAFKTWRDALEAGE